MGGPECAVECLLARMRPASVGITPLDYARGRALPGWRGRALGPLAGRSGSLPLGPARVLWRPFGRTSIQMAAIGPGCLRRARRWQCRQPGPTGGNCGGLGELFGRPENGFRVVSFLLAIRFTSAAADTGPCFPVPGRPGIVTGRQSSLERGGLDRAEDSASMAPDAARNRSLPGFGVTDGCG